MIDVIAFSDYLSPADNAKKLKKKLCLGEDGVYKNIRFVETAPYTHAIIFNAVKPKLDLPPSRVFGVYKEPTCTWKNLKASFAEYAKDHIGMYICQDNSDLPADIFKQWHCFNLNWIDTPVLELQHAIIDKPKTLSMIASNAKQWPGHCLRHSIIKEILKTDLEIDIFGRYLEKEYKDPRIKGTLKNKADGLLPYKFSLVIENNQEIFYMSEKFTDAIVCRTIPIYWGASTLEMMYGPSCIRFDPSNAMEQLKAIVKSPEDHLIDLQDARGRFFGEQFFGEVVWNYFNGQPISFLS